MSRKILGRLRALNRDQRALLISSFFWGFGMSLFLYIQPLYIARLGATPEQIGLVLGVSGTVVVFLYIPIGLWADRRGRKPVIVAGWSVGTAATYAMAMAPDWRWLIPAMTAFMLSNFAMPAHRGYIAASNQNKNLSWTFAVITTGASVGSVLSPAIGGWIGEQYGLRAVYFCAAVAFTLSTLSILQISRQPVEDEERNSKPKELLANRGFLWQIAFVLLVFFSIEVGQVMVPKYLEDVRGLNVAQIGWLGTVGSLGIVVWSLVFGYMSPDRRGSLILSQIAALLGLILLLISPLMTVMLLAYFVHGSNRVIRPVLQGRLGLSLQRGTLSFGFGFFESAMRMGLALAPYLAGVLYADDPSLPLFAGVIALSLTILLTFTLPSRSRARLRSIIFSRN